MAWLAFTGFKSPQFLNSSSFGGILKAKLLRRLCL